jgi:hypothetical protein
LKSKAWEIMDEKSFPDHLINAVKIYADTTIQRTYAKIESKL